jgi:hypothetical protein
MAIQGVDPNPAASLQVSPTDGPATTHNIAQKAAEAKTEAQANEHDGDEKAGVGANVNKLA